MVVGVGLGMLGLLTMPDGLLQPPAALVVRRQRVRGEPGEVGRGVPALVGDARGEGRPEAGVGHVGGRGDAAERLADDVVRADLRPEQLPGDLTTRRRWSAGSPSVLSVADVPTHWRAGDSVASRTRRTSMATSAPCRPR